MTCLLDISCFLIPLVPRTLKFLTLFSHCHTDWIIPIDLSSRPVSFPCYHLYTSIHSIPWVFYFYCIFCSIISTWFLYFCLVVVDTFYVVLNVHSFLFKHFLKIISWCKHCPIIPTSVASYYWCLFPYMLKLSRFFVC